MTDEEIRALVEEARAEADYRGQAVRIGSDKDESVEAAHLEDILNRCAAALTALIAERDEDRADMGHLRAHLKAADAERDEARRAALARAREIAESVIQHEDTATPVNSVWWENRGAKAVIAAIEAETQSEEQKP